MTTVERTSPDLRIGATELESIARYYSAVRGVSKDLCRPLATEDYVLQAMPDVSPAKWHLAHTTWFFDTFVLKEFLRDYKTFHPQFEYLFNSYYQSVGAQYPR